MLVRTKLFAAAIVGGALFVSLTGFGAWQAYRHLDAVQSAKNHEYHVISLAEIVARMIDERASVQNHLNTRTKASEEFRQALQEHRAREAELMGMALQETGQPISDNDPDVAALAALRAAADDQLNPEIKKGNLKLRRSWHPAMTEAIERKLDLVDDFAAIDRLSISPLFDQLRRLQSTVRRTGELVRRDAEMMAPLIAVGAPIAIGDLEHLSEQAGRLSELRRQLAKGTRVSDMELANAVVQLVEFLSVDYHEARLSAVIAGAQAQPFPIANDAWMAIADGATDLMQQVEAKLEVAMTSELAVSEKAAKRDLAANLLGLAAVLLLSIVSCWCLQRQIVNPLTTVSGLVRRLAGGELDIDFRPHRRTDEIGDIVDALDVFKASALRMQEMEAERIADAERQAASRKALLDDLALRFEANMAEIAKELETIVSDVASNTDLLAEKSAGSVVTCDALDQASENSDRNVQSIVSGIDELGSAAGTINGIVQDMRRVSDGAIRANENCEAQINSLFSRVGEIDEVVELISGITEQTSLLALNATIEAARAGDAGRGFAVVAQEVKLLAAQVSQATSKISDHIQEVQSLTKGTVAAVGDVSERIQKLAATGIEIESTVGQQSEEMARIAQVTRQTREVASVARGQVQTVGSQSAQTNAAVQELASAAARMTDRTASIKSSLNQFIRELRSA